MLSVERKSTHPVAQAVVRYAEKQDSVPMEITDMRELAGHGVEAIVNGRQVLVGNIRLLAERDIPVLKELSDSVSTVVVCAIDGNMRASSPFGYLEEGCRGCDSSVKGFGC